MPAPSPRGRSARLVGAAWLACAVGLAGCATDADVAVGPVPAGHDTGAPAPTSNDPAPSPEARTAAVARHGTVELVVPSRYALLVGFHEGGSAALELDVVGAVAADHAAAGVRTIAPDDRDSDAATVIVLPGRHRGTAPTTAMDVVVPPDRPIVSPLDGTVTAVEDYLLYDRHGDVRVVVSPHADDTVQAVILHLEDVLVAVGDEVRAGETIIAERARVLPEPSQIDTYTRRSVSEPAPPHVHLELRAAP